MPHSEAQAWWADVQHVREAIERRRAVGGVTAAPAQDARVEWHAEDAGGGRFTTRSGDTDRAHADRTRSPRRSGEEHAFERHDSERLRGDRHDTERRGRFTAPGDVTEAAAGGRRVVIEVAEPSTAGDLAGSGDADAGPVAHLVGDSTAPHATRTVQITGHPGGRTLPRLVEVERRRAPRHPAERLGRPDRIALWAVILGFFLILVAATSSQAATHPAAGASAPAALHAGR